MKSVDLNRRPHSRRRSSQLKPAQKVRLTESERYRKRAVKKLILATILILFVACLLVALVTVTATTLGSDSKSKDTSQVSSTFQCSPRVFQAINCQRCRNVRSINGACNNELSPLEDTTNSGIRRILPAEYENNNQPKGAELYNSVALPESGTVALLMYPFYVQPDQVPVRGDLFPHLAAFLALDLYQLTSDGAPCSCETVGRCFPIQLPLSDQCIPYARTQTVCPATEEGIWEQKNLASPYLDLSMIYGSDEISAEVLRDVERPSLLKEAKQRQRRQANTDLRSLASCVDLETLQLNRTCLGLGDEADGLDTMFTLTALHEVFMREHNRVAYNLQSLNPSWSQEQLYQVSRQIVISEFQHIIYMEFLPLLFLKGSDVFRTYTGYNQSLSVSVSNAFATTVFPLVHSQPAKDINKYSSSIKALLSSLLPNQESRRRRQSDQLNEVLEDDSYVELATMIQRGRDHGLASYNSYRRYCNLAAMDWRNLSSLVTDQNVVEALQTLYRHPDNIDLAVGLILEKSSEGLGLSPTQTCLLADSFNRLKLADRFFYMSVLSTNQLQSLSQVTLSRILCDNIEQIEKIPARLLVHTSLQGSPVDCELLPQLDLTLWTDEDNMLKCQ